MSDTPHFLTGTGKLLLYLRIILHVPCHYAGLLGKQPVRYVQFLLRALRLLLVFRHNKPVRTAAGWKLHLYLPAYPSPAFFYALESKLLRTPPGPTTVVFSMTKACSYHCPHCYQHQDAGADLEQPRLLDAAQAVVDAGVAFFNIEGGEPFLRFPRLLTLVQHLDRRTEVWINSTGAHRQPEMLPALKAAGAAGFIVSIHSPDAATHDAFTGVPGSFATACELLRACREAGLGTAINSVLSEAELRAGHLPQLMALARDLDCDFVQLIHPKPAGNWLERREQMQTAPDLIAEVRRQHLLYNSGARCEYPSLAAQVFEEAEHVLGCTAGAVDRFYINANGEVQPCEFLNLSFGNVTAEPFPEILARMRSFFPEPGIDWLCCTQANAIQALMHQHHLTQTPVPWPITQELTTTWHRGKPTPLYQKLGIYAK